MKLEIPSVALKPGQRIWLPLPWWKRWWNRLKMWILSRNWAECSLYLDDQGHMVYYEADDERIAIAVLDKGDDGTWR